MQLLNPNNLKTILINGINFKTNNQQIAHNSYLYLASHISNELIFCARCGALDFSFKDSYDGRLFLVEWYLDQFTDDGLITHKMLQTASKKAFIAAYINVFDSPSVARV